LAGLADKEKTKVLDSVVSGVAGLADTEKPPSSVLDSVVNEVAGLADKEIERLKASAPVKDLADAIFAPEPPVEIAEPAVEPKPIVEFEPSSFFGMGNDTAVLSAPEAKPEPQESKGPGALEMFTSAKVEAAKTKMAALLRELEAMRHTSEFKAFGFASNNPTATDWKEKVEALRNAFESDAGLPAHIKAMPAALLSTALGLQRGKGEDNPGVLRDLKDVAAEW